MYAPSNLVVIVFKRNNTIVDIMRKRDGKVKIYAHYPKPETIKKLGEGWTSMTSIALMRSNITQDLQQLLRGL
jgi:hypothetical protein